MKVIYLAFANSSEQKLPYLTEEDNGLNDILNDRYMLGDYVVVKESFITPERLNKALDKYKDNLYIFHYSGHAGKDKLLLDDEAVFSKGIARQLGYSAEKGALKMVVLNGCSTCGQVQQLRENKVPVIISTSAPVNDKSAKEFSLRFWEKLIKNDSPIEDAFKAALPAAESVTGQSLNDAYQRHLFTDDEPDCNEPNKPLWRMDCITEDVIKRPLVFDEGVHGDTNQKPNEKLVETLYQSFLDAGNPRVMELADREEKGVPVTTGERQLAIVNSIPLPIGIHLQRLICPSTGEENECYDSFGLKRLHQIGQFYQITTEFFAIIMISQLWELVLRLKEKIVISPLLKEKLNEYMRLADKSREVYDYIPLIQLIRQHMRHQEAGEDGYAPFIEEQEMLRDLFELDEDYREACNYLSTIRYRTINNSIDPARELATSYKTEDQLCIFVKPLGFIHRYHLTSIQNIDIMKFRHIDKFSAEYKHRIIRCMQALGKDEYNYYYSKSFLDNWGVLLLKADMKLIDRKRKRYEITVRDYLNLSPFVIDKNSFDKKATLSYIMFFRGFENDGTGDYNIWFQQVKNPLNARCTFPVKPEDKYEGDEKDMYEPIRLEFTAFQKIIT